MVLHASSLPLAPGAPLNSTRVRFADKFTFWGALWKDNQSFRMPGFLPGGSVDPVFLALGRSRRGWGVVQDKMDQHVRAWVHLLLAPHTYGTRPRDPS